MDLKSFSKLAQSVSFIQTGSKISLNDKDPELEFIGKGRSAYAFKIRKTNLVLKVFFSPFEHLSKQEADIYKALMDNPYYPTIYDSGDKYLVIDYIEGNTLFECLVKGIEIKEAQIREIDYALQSARKRGLNPSDIHLRNIFLTLDGKIKIIDVARFRQVKKCKQWDDLKKAYLAFYRRKLFPKKAPESMLNLIALLYKKNLIPSL